MSTTLQIMFLEKDGQFSIRKTLAVTCGIIFLIACGVSLIWPGHELPMTYLAIIASVFTYYFAKNRLSPPVGSSPAGKSSEEVV